jgi:hypothetical protein
MDIVGMTTRDIYLPRGIKDTPNDLYSPIYIHVLLSALEFRASLAALGFWRRDSGHLIVSEANSLVKMCEKK